MLNLREKKVTGDPNTKKFSAAQNLKDEFSGMRNLNIELSTYIPSVATSHVLW